MVEKFSNCITISCITNALTSNLFWLQHFFCFPLSIDFLGKLGKDFLEKGGMQLKDVKMRNFGSFTKNLKSRYMYRRSRQGETCSLGEGTESMFACVCLCVQNALVTLSSIDKLV